MKTEQKPKLREPKFKEDDSVKVIKTGKIETVESMGAWDKEAKEYRLLWSHGGIGFESDLEPISEKTEQKEVWQLTKKEFNSHPPKEVTYAGDTYKRTTKIRNGCRLYESKDFIECERDIHQEIIKEALKEGKPVPENVLVDYPELKKTPKMYVATNWELEKPISDPDKFEHLLNDNWIKYIRVGDRFEFPTQVQLKEAERVLTEMKKQPEPLYRNGNKVSYQSPDGWDIGIIENANYHEKNKNDILSLDGWYYEIKGIPNLKVSEKDVKPYNEDVVVANAFKEPSFVTKEYQFYKGIDFKYENQFQKNKAIEELINLKVKHEIITTQLMNRIEILENNLTSDETLFINSYTGMGGLDKFGATGQGILYEYYTPDEIIKMMWALAYKYGHKPSSCLEPSAGIGRFFKYAKNEVAVGYELNLKSAIICKILYPTVAVFNNYFEQLFIKNNNTIKDKTYTLLKHDLVIGNPPYGDIAGGGSKWLGMGEQKYTGATNYIDYFIFRGLDLLLPQGLLIFIVGAEKHNGGKLFLEKATSKIKEAIAEKCELVDAYKLPTKLFQTTNVSSEILVLRKK